MTNSRWWTDERIDMDIDTVRRENFEVNETGLLGETAYANRIARTMPRFFLCWSLVYWSNITRHSGMRDLFREEWTNDLANVLSEMATWKIYEYYEGDRDLQTRLLYDIWNYDYNYYEPYIVRALTVSGFIERGIDVLSEEYGACIIGTLVASESYMNIMLSEAKEGQIRDMLNEINRKADQMRQEIDFDSMTPTQMVSSMESIIEEVVDPRQYGLITEMAVSRKQFMKDLRGLSIQIFENWLLVRYQVITGQMVYRKHWARELITHLRNIQRTKIKENNSFDTRYKALVKVWDMYDFFDPADVESSVTLKMKKERCVNEKDRYFVEALSDLMSAQKDILKILASEDDGDMVQKYVEKLAQIPL